VAKITLIWRALVGVRGEEQLFPLVPDGCLLPFIVLGTLNGIELEELLPALGVGKSL
jgi:hypothetical protein